METIKSIVVVVLSGVIGALVLYGAMWHSEKLPHEQAAVANRAEYAEVLKIVESRLDAIERHHQPQQTRRIVVDDSGLEPLVSSSVLEAMIKRNREFDERLRYYEETGM